MQRKGRSAPHRARAYLVELIERLWSHGGTRLPTVRELCREGGFSPATMSAALRQLRQEGILSVAQRGGIRVLTLPAGGPRTASCVSREHKDPPRWRQVKHSIAADIVRGRYSPGQKLPMLKELRAEYGACFTTVKRALHSLVDDRKIVRHGRGYRVFAPAPQSTHACIVLIAHQNAPGALGTAIPWNPEFLRVLESECRRLGVRLVACGASNDDIRRGMPVRMRHGDVVLGYMLWTCGFAHELFGGLLQACARRGRPVAVLDETGALPMLDALRAHPCVRVYTVCSSRDAGIAVGNHLLSSGRHSVVYLSPVGASKFCRLRYDGIVQAYEEAGYAGRVRRYALKEHEAFRPILDAALQRNRAFRAADKAIRRLERVVEQGDGWDSDLLYAYYSRTYLMRRAMQMSMGPLFEQALRETDATAWVGMNDCAAMIAMGFLRARGIDVPGRIGVVGFDNTFEAFSHGLTSYDFNMPALVRAMLDHILRPPSGPGTTPLPPLEVSGEVFVRGSTTRKPPPEIFPAADRSSLAR